jgi:hypothetical protein
MACPFCWAAAVSSAVTAAAPFAAAAGLAGLAATKVALGGRGREARAVSEPARGAGPGPSGGRSARPFATRGSWDDGDDA